MPVCGCVLDQRASTRPGFKFNEWELKGVPVRIEVGARDLAAAVVTVARRDTGAKLQVPLGRVGRGIQELLGEIQASLFRAALADRERRTLRDPGSYAEMIEYLREARRVRLGAVVRQRGMRGARQGRELGSIRCMPLGEQPERSAVASAAVGTPRAWRCRRRRTDGRRGRTPCRCPPAASAVLWPWPGGCGLLVGDAASASQMRLGLFWFERENG